MANSKLIFALSIALLSQPAAYAQISRAGKRFAADEKFMGTVQIECISPNGKRMIEGTMSAYRFHRDNGFPELIGDLTFSINGEKFTSQVVSDYPKPDAKILSLYINSRVNYRNVVVSLDKKIKDDLSNGSHMPTILAQAGQPIQVEDNTSTPMDCSNSSSTISSDAFDTIIQNPPAENKFYPEANAVRYDAVEVICNTADGKPAIRGKLDKYLFFTKETAQPPAYAGELDFIVHNNSKIKVYGELWMRKTAYILFEVQNKDFQALRIQIGGKDKSNTNGSAIIYNNGTETKMDCSKTEYLK